MGMMRLSVVLGVSLLVLGGAALAGGKKPVPAAGSTKPVATSGPTSPVATSAPTNPVATSGPANPVAVSGSNPRGARSPVTENEANDPDPAPRPRPASSAGASQVNTRILAGATHVPDLPSAPQFLAALQREIEKLNLNVALVGGNKYMVSDCVGIKASAGQFFLRPGSVTLRTEGSGVLLKFVVEKVALNALSVRVRPNVGNPAALCKFSKRIGVHGSASNVRFEVRFDPLMDLRACKVLAPGAVRTKFVIGGFNLAPLQNDLDKVAKNMVEEAVNLYLDGPDFREFMLKANANALNTTCTAGV